MGSVEEEEVLARHRRELRELQGRITNKKKNATKKTRRGVLDECAALERRLHEKHEAELRALRESDRGGADGEGEEDDEREGEKEDEKEGEMPRRGGADGSIGGAASRLAGTKPSDDDDDDEGDAEVKRPSDSRAAARPPPPPQQPKKRNRQRERLARRAAALEQDQSAAAAEAATMVDHAAVERGVLAPLIARSGRAEHEIRPDGHCLFSAVADQMAQLGRGVGAAGQDGRSTSSKGSPPPPPSSAEPYRHVRWAAASYMEAHPDDFAPFLIGDDDDDNETGSGSDRLSAHIARIRDTAEWGGQLELRALASTYRVDIRVLHDGRSELIRPAGAEEKDDDTAKDGRDGEKQQRPVLWLVYYRHGFGLGEHYNSLRSKAE